jgi:hypothetical protein
MVMASRWSITVASDTARRTRRDHGLRRRRREIVDRLQSGVIAASEILSAYRGGKMALRAIRNAVVAGAAPTGTLVCAKDSLALSKTRRVAENY